MYSLLFILSVYFFYNFIMKNETNIKIMDETIRCLEEKLRMKDESMSLLELTLKRMDEKIKNQEDEMYEFFAKTANDAKENERKMKELKTELNVMNERFQWIPDYK